MSLQSADQHLDRAVGWPERDRQNLTLPAVVRMGLMDEDWIPLVAQHRTDRGIRRAPVFRRRPAFINAIEGREAGHAG
ncbi:hypothetical protein [Stenotrophomonas maltophilia]|uniref:hypothetical protein n=1 Tax=Stenotrophomonas maltophilia TaxID=40324 RepID=UPI000DAA06B5|nr:hypothetical protein [Stenotrophomonas maltophilia]